MSLDAIFIVQKQITGSWGQSRGGGGGRVTAIRNPNQRDLEDFLVVHARFVAAASVDSSDKKQNTQIVFQRMYDIAMLNFVVILGK